MSARVQTIDWLNARIDALEAENSETNQRIGWKHDALVDMTNTANDLSRLLEQERAAHEQTKADLETWKTRLEATDKMYDLRKAELASAREEMARLKQGHAVMERDMNSALLSRDRALSVLRDVSDHFEWVEDDGSTALLKRIDAIIADAESSAAGAAIDCAWKACEEHKAKLGAAVAALHQARDHIAATDRGHPDAMPAIAAADAILDDVESSAAGEAYGELVAVYEAAKAVRDRSSFGPAYRVTDAVLRAALAKVDARRSGKDGAR